MSISTSPEAAVETQTTVGPRRLWLPAILVTVSVTCLVLPYWVEFQNMETMFGLMFLGPMITGGGVLLWWLFLSGIAWRDRLLGLFALAAAGGAAFALADESVRFALLFYGPTAVCVLWIGYLVLTAWMSWPARRAGLVAVLALAVVGISLLRIEGVWGDFRLQLGYRFGETREDRYVKSQADGDEAGPVTAEVLKLAPGDWPGFRGPGRDGRVVGVTVPTDWKQSPPEMVWKRPIGPGWSSFAVVGHRLFTQEQRGPHEVVVCLDADTGKQLWAHKDEVRFAEAIGGAGPRATPTFHDGRLYTLGAKGTLNCLDAATGKPVWSRDIVKDSGAKVPEKGEWWGFCSSPLVARGIVSVVASMTEGKLVLGYKADTGELAWASGDGKHSYCSTQLVSLEGVEQLLVASDRGMTALHADTGKVLWSHHWEPYANLARVVQPSVLGVSDVLLGTGFKYGTRRLRLQQTSTEWNVEQVWETKAISPYFNDFVIHNGHIYGFDDTFFTCVNLDEGEKRWRARGYDQGQVLLLAEQGLLLIVSEKGQVALVKADPEKHTVLGKFKALEGKTWNHPAVAHGKLFVRNGEEMACYRLVPESK